MDSEQIPPVPFARLSLPPVPFARLSLPPVPFARLSQANHAPESDEDDEQSVVSIESDLSIMELADDNDDDDDLEPPHMYPNEVKMLEKWYRKYGNKPGKFRKEGELLGNKGKPRFTKGQIKAIAEEHFPDLIEVNEQEERNLWKKLPQNLINRKLKKTKKFLKKFLKKAKKHYPLMSKEYTWEDAKEILRNKLIRRFVVARENQLHDRKVPKYVHGTNPDKAWRSFFHANIDALTVLYDAHGFIKKPNNETKVSMLEAGYGADQTLFVSFVNEDGESVYTEISKDDVGVDPWGKPISMGLCYTLWILDNKTEEWTCIRAGKATALGKAGAAMGLGLEIKLTQKELESTGVVGRTEQHHETSQLCGEDKSSKQFPRTGYYRKFPPKAIYEAAVKAGTAKKKFPHRRGDWEDVHWVHGPNVNLLDRNAQAALCPTMDSEGPLLFTWTIPIMDVLSEKAFSRTPIRAKNHYNKDDGLSELFWSLTKLEMDMVGYAEELFSACILPLRSSVSLSYGCEYLLGVHVHSTEKSILPASGDQPTKKNDTRHEAKWAKRYRELAFFMKEEGHSVVPNKIDGKKNKLASWVSQQRTNYKKGLLSDERLAKLEKIGFEFEFNRAGNSQHYGTQSHANPMIEQLEAFYKKNFHSLATKVDNKKLGSWIDYIRKTKKEGRLTLSDEHLRRLEQVEFQWDVSENSEKYEWYKMFKWTVSYYQKHGHCYLLPLKYSGRGRNDHEFYKLKNFATELRRRWRDGEMEEQEVEKWNKIKFEFDQGEADWHEMRLLLKKNIAENGGKIRVDKRKLNTVRLGAWVTEQREKKAKNELSREHIEELEKIKHFRW